MPGPDDLIRISQDRGRNGCSNNGGRDSNSGWWNMRSRHCPCFHRKGIRSVVLERSESLVATGSAITIFTNGWRALDQLGVASRLRQTAIPIHGLREISLDDGSQHKLPVGQEELRCLKRSILIKTLAQDLPAGTLLFGCHVIKVNFDPLTSCHVLHLQDGNFIKAKIRGCLKIWR